jgi:hypothetical protein
MGKKAELERFVNDGEYSLTQEMRSKIGVMIHAYDESIKSIIDTGSEAYAEMGNPIYHIGEDMLSEINEGRVPGVMRPLC